MNQCLNKVSEVPGYVKIKIYNFNPTTANEPPFKLFLISCYRICIIIWAIICIQDRITPEVLSTSEQFYAQIEPQKMLRITKTTFTHQRAKNAR